MSVSTVADAGLNRVRLLQDYRVARRIAREFEEQETWPRERMAQLQQTKLDKLVRHAVEKSPFYRGLYAGVDLAKPIDIQTLPTVNKATLMTNFDAAVTDRRVTLWDLERHPTLLDGPTYLGRYLASTTTGSSGHKGTYLLDRYERSVTLAAMMRRQSWIEERRKGLGLGRLVNVSANANFVPKLGWTWDSRLRPTRLLTLDFRDRVGRMVAALNSFQPERMWGVSSTFALLAAEQLDGRLRIEPKLVTTCGELLTEDMKARMTEAWGVTPYDVWGCVETGGMAAADCSQHRGLHVFEGRSILEVVDEQNRPLPAGVTGDKLLITNLDGYGLPRIRFEVTDFVRRLEESCPCGRTMPLIDISEGRSEDTLYMPGRSGQPVFMDGFHFRLRVARYPGVKEHQVIYDGKSLRVLVAMRDGASPDGIADEVRSRLRESLDMHDIVLPEICVEIVESDKIERDPLHRGKLKLIVDKTRNPAGVTAEGRQGRS